MTQSAFHDGEVALQKRVGVAEKMAEFGDRILRPFMPNQHREFFETLPMFFIGSEDGAGDVWASVLYGPPGFVQSPTDTTLNIQGNFPPEDPLAQALTVNKHVALLGIELPTRRRNRANGRIAAHADGQIEFQLEQSFGNCPKYIQPRFIFDTKAKVDPVAQTFSKFDAEVADRLQTLDTFFIASRSVGKTKTTTESDGGFDISHRGGPAGFVQIIDESTLVFPDFVGNNFFNTFGNIALDPQVGLLFVDFENGHHIYLTGTAEVLWKQDGPLSFEGVEREVRFKLKSGKLVKNLSPYRWRPL